MTRRAFDIDDHRDAEVSSDARGVSYLLMEDTAGGTTAPSIIFAACHPSTGAMTGAGLTKDLEVTRRITCTEQSLATSTFDAAAGSEDVE